MRFLAYITISAIVYLPPGSANIIECTRLQRNSTCFIEGLSLQLASDEYAITFPSSTHITMESCEILHFPASLFDALVDTGFLTLKGGLIPVVTFRSESLHSLRIDNTGLREFSVSPLENRNLNTLIVSGNPLRVIPPTIRHLTSLSILDLSNNQLEFVNLNWFQTMGNLLMLDLSSNRIARLNILPSLRLQRLKNFWINHNRLREMVFFPAFAPALQRVRLVDNLWRCDWVAQARQSIWSSAIQVYGAENICPDELHGGLCCNGADQLETLGGRYEIVSVTMDGRDSNPPVEQFSRADPLRAGQDSHEDTQLTALKRSYDVLGQKYRRVVEEKELLEKRFVNTVRELEGTVRRLTAELSDAQNGIRLRGV